MCEPPLAPSGPLLRELAARAGGGGGSGGAGEGGGGDAGGDAAAVLRLADQVTLADQSYNTKLAFRPTLNGTKIIENIKIRLIFMLLSFICKSRLNLKIADKKDKKETMHNGFEYC